LERSEKVSPVYYAFDPPKIKIIRRSMAKILQTVAAVIELRP
jgi:hypothetical protein